MAKRKNKNRSLSARAQANMTADNSVGGKAPGRSWTLAPYNGPINPAALQSEDPNHPTSVHSDSAPWSSLATTSRAVEKVPDVITLDDDSDDDALASREKERLAVKGGNDTTSTSATAIVESAQRQVDAEERTPVSLSTEQQRTIVLPTRKQQDAQPASGTTRMDACPPQQKDAQLTSRKRKKDLRIEKESKHRRHPSESSDASSNDILVEELKQFQPNDSEGGSSESKRQPAPARRRESGNEQPLAHSPLELTELVLGVTYNIPFARFFDGFFKQYSVAVGSALSKLGTTIERYYLINAQSEAVFGAKMRILSEISRICGQMFPNASALAVGSTYNGCGAYCSDMDVCMRYPDLDSRKSAQRKQYLVNILHKIRPKLRHMQPSNVLAQVIPARVPILRIGLRDPANVTNPRAICVECDINVNNTAGVRNTHLLAVYSRVDVRFPMLTLLLKDWAKRRGINDAVNGTLNSYSIELMVVHFLQCAVHPPVLPNIQYIYPQYFNVDIPIEQLTADYDNWERVERPVNTDGLGALLVRLFHYYAHFDWHKHGISIRNAALFQRSPDDPTYAHALMHIEEPFDLANTARCVSRPYCLDRIVSAFKQASLAFTVETAARAPLSLDLIGIELPPY